MDKTLAPVPKPEPLTNAQTLIATAHALDAKNKREWDAARAIEAELQARLDVQAEKLARARLKKAKPAVQPGWGGDYVVEFTVRLSSAELAEEIAALKACPKVKRINFDEYLKLLRKQVRNRNTAKVEALVKDPAVQKRLLEFGESLLAGASTPNPIEA